MIDIHCHVLPQVDDGPSTMDDSLLIVQQACEAGVSGMIATPHVLENAAPGHWSTIRHTFDGFKKQVERLGMDIDLFLGAELFMSTELAQQIGENPELTIAAMGRYALVEMPMQDIPIYAEHCIFEMLVQGVVPIIAHPERNLAIQKKPGRLANLVKRGVLCQLNAGSLMGLYGKKAMKTAHTLLKKNYIDVLASDVHRPGGTDLLVRAVKYAETLVGPEEIARMTIETPAKILRGET